MCWGSEHQQLQQLPLVGAVRRSPESLLIKDVALLPNTKPSRHQHEPL